MRVATGAGARRSESSRANAIAVSQRLRTAAVMLPLLIALVPPTLVATSIVRYGVGVPVWDEWSFAPLVSDAAEGRLDGARLWAQHNEHRVVLPRLLLLGPGWAQDPSDNQPARAALIVADGVVLGRTPTGVHRPDVVKATTLPSLRHSGWRFRFASYRLQPGTHRIEAFAVVGDGTAVVRLAGSSDVTIRP